MGSSELPEDVRRLVEASVPNLEAMELLLILARDPGREWHAQALPALLPAQITVEQATELLRLFASQRIMIQRGDAWVFEPSAEKRSAVEGFIIAYHQRPVTLIRTVYEAADMRRLRSFADAFKFRKDS